MAAGRFTSSSTPATDARADRGGRRPFYDTRDSRLAITGGTGRYADASGWMELRAREGGTKFDFVFHLSH